MSENGADKRSEAFAREVAERFGVLPNFFCSAPAAGGLVEELWAFAKSAYLDSPFPSLFKERLFIHLSRFCKVRYCIVRHVGFLVGEGHPSGDPAANSETVEQALALLSRPVPESASFEQIFKRLETWQRRADMPSPGTPDEGDLFDGLTVVFLRPDQSDRARAALRSAVGDKNFELLVAFLAFVRTAHYWTEVHPDLAYEPDIIACMERYPELARVLLKADEAEAVSPEAIQSQLAATKTSLRESEQHIRTIFESMEDGFCVAEKTAEEPVDFRYILANPAFERLTGFGDPIGKTMRQLVPEVDAATMAAYTRVATTGKPETFTSHGLGKWYEVQAVATEHAGGIGVLFRDVTAALNAEAALRENQKRQAFLLQLSDALRPLTDAVAIQTTAARLLGEHLKISSVTYSQVEADQDTFIIHGDYSDGRMPSLAGWRSRLSAHGPGYAPTLLAGETIAYSDIREDPAAHSGGSAESAEMSLVAGAAVPLIKNGRLVAFLSFAHPEPRSWRESELQLLRDVAERTWAAVERAHAEAALRDSEARYQALFAASPVPFMLLAANPPDFTILAANEAYFAATLTTRETLIGRRLFDVFPDDPNRPGQLGSEALDISLERVLRTRRTDAMERVRYDIVAPSGGFEAHWWLAINAPLLDATGNVTAIIHQVDRQTELHYAEEALQKHEERQAFLLELSDTLRTNLDPVSIQEEATKLLGQRLGVNRAIYFEFVEEAGQEFIIAQREYRTAGTLRFEGRHAIEQFGSDEPALRAGRIIAVEDTELEAVPDARRAGWRALGVRSRMSVPLMKAGRPTVGLGVHSAEPRTWSPDDIALTREVGERTWEAVQRARAESALRKSETRLRQFGEASQDVLWIRDASTLQWQYLTPAFEAIYGIAREEALSGNNYRSWLDLILTEDRKGAAESIERVRAGENVTFDYRIKRPRDGMMRWLRNTDFPIVDENGQVALIGGIGHDLTELRETELRLQMILEGIPQLVWRAVGSGTWSWVSPQWTDYTGLSNAESRGWGWLDAVHFDDRPAATMAWTHAIDTGGFEVELRLLRKADHEYRWFQTRATPVRNKAGEIIEWLGTSTDIHELREIQNRQKVLVAELQHRTRNLMGVVRSIADKSTQSSADLNDFRSRFRDRLEALARVQGLLSRLHEHDRVTFDELIRTEVSALNGDAERVNLTGPSGIRLRSSTVQTLALALHELATNAIKYGALRQPSGLLAVEWTLEPARSGGQPWLHIDWRETGVPMPSAADAPLRFGQGRELIERALPYQLKARTHYELGPDGVHCTISVPVSDTTAFTELTNA